MSPSRSAADPHADPAELHGLDILVSVLVHALVVGTVVALALWEVHHTPKPLQRIQVSMITPAQLQRMMHPPAKPKPHHAKPHPKQARPQPSKTPTLSKPAKNPAKPEKPFDPFAPLESKQDVSAAPARRHADNHTVADMQMQQMSQQEINRYIAMIQAAVERHWKVPVNLGDVKNPLVELDLNPNGSVAAIRILESSGNAALDASLGRAIMAAAPFQLPVRQFEAFRHNRIRFIPKQNQQP